MRINYSNFKQGDLVIIDARFSNQEESKIRPALVISSHELNEVGEDIITLKVTSQLKPRPFDITLTNNNLVAGELRSNSVIRGGFPIVVAKNRVIKKIGSVNPKIISQVKEKLRLVFEI